jgi:hypothetical protein
MGLTSQLILESTSKPIPYKIVYRLGRGYSWTTALYNDTCLLKRQERHSSKHGNQALRHPVDIEQPAAESKAE